MLVVHDEVCFRTVAILAQVSFFRKFLADFPGPSESDELSRVLRFRFLKRPSDVGGFCLFCFFCFEQ